MQAKSYLSRLILIGLVFNTRTAIAQTYTPSNLTPIADNTLGTQVSGTGNNFNITGGLTRGQTLFHSFTDFSVPTSGAANFTNPVGNRDIITRVTGTNFSDINGLINSNGANFFLINPNGITFGTNATLNVGRAFMASTANGLNLVDPGGQSITFGTNTSGDAPLLSIAPNVLFNVSGLTIGGSNGQINNFGTLQTTNSSQYIGLIGGNVTFNGGGIIAPAAKVELGGLAQSGTVGFSLNDGIVFSSNVERGNVSLVSNGTVPSLINVEAGGGGSVTVFAKDITLQGTGTRIRAGIAAGLGSPTAKAGDIKLNATGDVKLSDRAGIRNRVNLGSQGKSGDIEVITRNLSVTNGSGLIGGTAGKGDAGNIQVAATGDVFFDGVQNSLPSVAFNVVDKGAEGKGGGIEIVAGNLSITNGAGLVAGTNGKGDAGNIKITATGNVSFSGNNLSSAGSNEAVFLSGALVDVSKGADGKGGEIEIVADNLSISNTAALQASTNGKGDAGNIKILVNKNVSFDDGYAFNNVNSSANGNGGTIDIRAINVSFTNGGQLTTSTYAKGDAGNIKINAAGNVSFDGRKDGFSSSALSKVNKGAQGQGGTIEIIADNLFITNGGDLQAATYGTGNAGNIKISVKDNVSLDNSSVFSRVEKDAIGKGGNIEIVTQNLFATNGGQLTASTYGKGDAGNIKITATENVSFDGVVNGFSSGAFSSIEKGGDGKAGGIDIASKILFVSNDAQLVAGTKDKGEAGDVFIKSNNIVLDKGKILSKSTNSTGGNINIFTTDYLLMRNSSVIATDSDSVGKNGNGGNITINSPLIIAIPTNNDITANAYNGAGGKVTITSQGLLGIQFRPKGQESAFTNDITASSTFGRDGNVNIDTPGTDPGRDSTELPNTTTDASNQISQACSADSRQNQLIVTGRGGLPPNAYDPLTSDVIWQDARANNSQPAATSATNTSTTLAPPAVGWVFDGKGKVTLIAAAIQGQPTGSQLRCPKIERSASGNK